jgi:beta-glucosidase
MRLEDNPSYSNFPGDTRTVEYREGIYVGYRYYDTAQMEVRYPFGHGLSYTTFRYGRARVNHDSITAGDRVTVSIDIANTGDCAGAEVVQLYVSNRGRSIFTPEQELKGFERVYLEPGQTRIVNFNLNARAFSYYSTDIHDWCVETGDYVIRIGSASRDIRAAVRIHVDSEDPLHSPLPEAARCYWDLTSGFDPTEEEFHALFEHAAPEDDEDIGGERFSINSTVREMREVWIGRRIYNQILKRAAKESAESGGSAAVDESFIDFLQDAPLRTVLMAGGDTVNRQMLDGVVDMLNGHGVRGFVKVMRGRK